MHISQCLSCAVKGKGSHRVSQGLEILGVVGTDEITTSLDNNKLDLERKYFLNCIFIVKLIALNHICLILEIEESLIRNTNVLDFHSSFSL